MTLAFSRSPCAPLSGLSKTDNVGALFRSALAFGVSGIFLSPGCADPLYRKSIRASMGAVFKLPFRIATRCVTCPVYLAYFSFLRPGGASPLDRKRIQALNGGSLQTAFSYRNPFRSSWPLIVPRLGF
jgi:hypothetical protein